MSKMAIFMQVFHNLEGRVKYLLGAKIDVSKDSADPTIRRVDCSGFSRFEFVKMGFKNVPDGSQNQLAWCEASGWHRLAKYSDVGLQDVRQDGSRLFVAFMKPKFIGRRQIASGHVFYVRKGMTYESCYGRGVSSRPWNTLVLKMRACAAYEVPLA